MNDVTITEKTLHAGGTLDKMNFSLVTQYNARREAIRGSLSGTMNLTGLDYQEMVSVGNLSMALDTTFNGRLSSTFEISKVLAEQEVNLLMKQIHYASPEVGLRLEDLSLSADLQEDLDNQQYTVDALRVTSESLMEVQLAGDFQQKSQNFTVALDIPYVNIGELQHKLSGQTVQSLTEINPRGEVSLSVKATGRVPQEQDLKQLDIPVTLDTKLSLKNVHGAFADYQVNGAEGTVALSFAPGKRPVVDVKSDLTFPKLELKPGLPLERISDAYATFNVLTTNFNDVDVNAFRVGMKGLDFSLKGSIGGIRKMIESKKEVMSIFPDVFAQVNTNAQVTLEEFQQVLTQYGLSGTGQAQLGLSLLKKERGPLALAVKLGSRDINVSQDGTRVEHIKGQINVRKRVDWLDQPNPKTKKPVFRPSDILSQLRSITGREKSLTIDRLDLGFVAISDFSANILFDQDAFKIQNLGMNLMDGGLGGNLIVTGGKAFGVAGQFEAAQLDLNQLLEDKLKISGDSRVDATIGLSVFFDEKTGALDLSRTEMKWFITHIGQEAVDRLLVFLDPEGSNPTLVTARSQIKLANPSNVSLQLTRGMLNLEIHFSEGLLPPFILKRIPVGKMKQFKAITEGIPDWQNIRETMNVVGAKTYGLDNQGKLVFQ